MAWHGFDYVNLFKVKALDSGDQPGEGEWIIDIHDFKTSLDMIHQLHQLFGYKVIYILSYFI